MSFSFDAPYRRVPFLKIGVRRSGGGNHQKEDAIMNEEQKREVAIFRFGVIHDLVGGSHLERGDQQRLLREKCGRRWVVPHSSRTRLTRSTILRWIQRYKQGNGKLESLYPTERSDCGVSRGLDEESSLALVQLRKESPRIPVTDLIKTIYKRRLVPPGKALSLSTVYRLLHRHHLMGKGGTAPEDRRKFEAELPNDLWQSDSMHGPQVDVDGRKRKTYLLAFLDDHSRLVPHAQFYLSEGLSSYLHALEQALLRRGLPRKLYLDNGPAFRSKHLEDVTASLGIALIHSSPYKPQGRGKIERFFRTVRSQFLPGFRGKSLDELNEALDLWIQDLYHQRKHTSTGKSPFERFTAHMQCLRPAPKDLQNYFRKHTRRRVGKDRTVVLDGKLYEAPIPLIGKHVLLLYHEKDLQSVEVLHNHKSYGFLTPLDLHINCRVRRNKESGTEMESTGKGDKYQGGRLWSGKEDDLL
jgi:transposase InsO family protein